ncbi:MAG: potassium channel protein [Myxococcales bacterium]|nr:potassium channel protein [Myxococcales bacterium]MCB9578252.1 potassium channel protein [Polyangiaceae bacterium]
MNLSFRRVLRALLVLFLVIHLGAFGIWLFGGGEYGLLESIYFAIYTVATVGYAELPHLDQHGFARMFNGALIIAGIGAIAYFQSTLTAMLVEGVIGRVWRRGRMKNKIEGLREHYVVAGCGRTGKYVVEELTAVGRGFVVVDKDEALLERMSAELGGKLLFIVGDATEDHTLQEAGISRASGVIAALSDDRDNLFVTLTARTLNPDLRIVSKAVEIENEGKLLRAGADTTVSPNRIGGHRLVSELVRPRVTAFLDQMLRVTENLRFEEVTVPEGSPWVGRSLRSVPIRDRTNLLVVALHEPDGSYVYNPSPDRPLAAGTQLIVMGELDSVQKLRAMVDAPRG